MNADAKLALIAQQTKEAGLNTLVMGGHAVRYYGVDRNTVDYDMVTAASTTNELREKLATIPMLASAKEITDWRTGDFARFEIGTLPDGRQELLKFWLHNHLLPDFGALSERAEVGKYGGGDVSFLSLDDLLRSKETERESDWQDIALLEEIRDARLFANAVAPEGVLKALMNVRSRRGLERIASSELLRNNDAIVQAIQFCTHPVTFAILSPLAPHAQPRQLLVPIEPTSLAVLAKATFKSSFHLGVIEAVRRSYKRWAMDNDRLDKQAKIDSLKGS